MTLPRSVELCWQKDVIERWLNTAGVPADAHAELLEMLRDLKAEMDISVPCTPDVPESGKRVAPFSRQETPMRFRVFLLTLTIFLTVLVPTANADSFSLFCGGTLCGTVTVSNIAGGVSVGVDMTGGYSIQAKANSGGFFFNTVGGTTLTLTNFIASGFGSVGANLISGVNNGAGSFTYGVVKYGIPNGNTSVTGISFDLIGNISTSSFIANNNGNVLGVHFCSPGEQITNCPDPTGFTTMTTSVTTVPEPGTLSLLATGLVGLAGIVRRRFLS